MLTKVPAFRHGFHGACLALAAVLLASCQAADWIDGRLNDVYGAAPARNVPYFTTAQSLHDTLFIADLHADTLLWDRDLLEESDFGHVDLPRLIEGNVALQVFSIPTQTPLEASAPRGARLTNPAARRCIAEDNLNPTGILHALQGRPVALWHDTHARALDQIKRLTEFIAESERRHAADPTVPYLMLIGDVADLETLITARSNDEPVVGTMLAIEGADWIGGEGMGVEAGVAEMVDRGVRMLAPTHRFDNALGASSEGCDQSAGLTQDGLDFLRTAEARGIVLDLAHASDLGIAQAVEGRSGPIVISHTGVRSQCNEDNSDDDCDFERNLPDNLIQAVARNGGVIGIGYWPGAVGRGMGRVVQAFAATRDALSDPRFVAEMRAIDPGYDPYEHIALGSDFDGAVGTPFDTGDLEVLTAALTTLPTADGAPAFNADALRLVYGANVCRVFALRLRGGGPEVAERICAPLRRPGWRRVAAPS